MTDRESSVFFQFSGSSFGSSANLKGERAHFYFHSSLHETQRISSFRNRRRRQKKKQSGGAKKGGGGKGKLKRREESGKQRRQKKGRKKEEEEEEDKKMMKEKKRRSRVKKKRRRRRRSVDRTWTTSSGSHSYLQISVLLQLSGNIIYTDHQLK